MFLSAAARHARAFLLLLALCAALCVKPAAGGAAESMATPGPVQTAAPANGLTWRNIGPSVAGGRVSTVAGSDLDPALFYAGTAGGGLWKSSNGALDWQPVFDATNVASIGAVAISPLNKDDVWVGTGEAWPRNDVIAGSGVYHSVDGGQTWKHRALEATSQIARIINDPRNSERILVAALGSPFADSDERGVYRSDDGGQTWRKTLFTGRSTGASDIAIDPARPDIVYAGMWQFRRNAWHLTSGGDADGLYKSVDGGQTWRALSGNGLPAGPLGRIGLAVAPSDPNRVYAVIESSAGLLWRSDDGGDHWQLVSSNTLINERPFYYSRIVVDPHDANHLFSVSVHLAESNNGGKAWHLSGEHVHGDHHDLWIARDGNVILDANDGGAAISRDGGRSWDWRTNLTIAQVYHVGYDRRRPYTVCAGLQDNGAWCGPSATGDERGILQTDWTAVGGGDGTWTWPDPLDPAIIWSASGGGDNGGQLSRFAFASGSAIDVSPYLRDQNVVAPHDLRYRFNWESPLAFSPFERGTAYFGANVVLRSGDRGASWQPISPDLTRNLRARQGLSGTPLRRDVTGAETFDTILDIAPSPLVRGVMWVGTDDGNVQLTRDGGSTWLNVMVPVLDADARVVSIEASHASPGRAYIAVDRHFTGDMRPYIFVSDDYGATWRSIVANLEPGDFVHVVREDPHNPAILFAGTERGVWWSANRGAAWEPFPARLPPTPVRDLRIQPDAGDLIAGTHGRGIWIFDDLRALEGRAQAEAAGQYLFAPRDAVLARRDTTTTLTRAAGANPEAPASVTFYQRAPAAAPAAIDIVDTGGHIVRHLAGMHDVDERSVAVVPNEPGLNRVFWDLCADGPTPWERTPKWNRAPEHGVPILSGKYTVLLHRDGATLRSVIRVNADRRAVPTDRDELRGHAFLSGLYGELSQIDDALNVLDNLRMQLPARATSLDASSGDATLAARLRALAAQSADIERVLTSQPENSQDDDFLEDLLRERLVTFISSASRSTPTNEQLREAAALARETNAALDRYRTFLAAEILPLQHELARAGAALDLAEKPSPDPKPGPNVDERADRRPEE
jgi:photosystem II stability/assembly factor-like uncharacterized protein